MAEKIISLGTGQMRQIARYEITFKDIIAAAPFDEGDITCEGEYSFTLEDLYHAIKALKASDPTVKEFGQQLFRCSLVAPGGCLGGLRGRDAPFRNTGF